MIVESSVKILALHNYAERRFKVVVSMMESITDPPWALCYWPNMLKLQWPDDDDLLPTVEKQLEIWYAHCKVESFEQLVEHYFRVRLLAMAATVMAESITPFRMAPPVVEQIADRALGALTDILHHESAHSAMEKYSGSDQEGQS